MTSTDIEWENFLMMCSSKVPMEMAFETSVKPTPEQITKNYEEIPKKGCHKEEIVEISSTPICDDLYISTKTKVLYLNQEIDIQRIFWDIPILEYWKQQEGVIKKQMKIVSKTKEEFEAYQERLKEIPYYKDYVILKLKITKE